MDTIVALQSLAHPFLDAVAMALTNLGAEEAYVAMLLVVYVAIDARAGRILGLTLLASFYANQHLKEAFDTARPYVLHPDLLRGGEAAAGTGPGPAFPSGHAQSATTFWGLGAVLAARPWFAGVAVALIVLVSATRVYLGVHWPIDIVGGLLVGGLFVAAGVAWIRRPPRLPGPVRVALVTLVPLAAHLLWTTPESGIIAGAFVAFGLAPMIVAHRPAGSVVQRAATALLGLALVFAWLLGTSALLPDAVKENVWVAPARYLVLGLLGLVATPWLARRLGLVPHEAR